jgi:hypothetical protein
MAIAFPTRLLEIYSLCDRSVQREKSSHKENHGFCFGVGILNQTKTKKVIVQEMHGDFFSTYFKQPYVLITI